jgi:hypothetical protein
VPGTGDLLFSEFDSDFLILRYMIYVIGSSEILHVLNCLYEHGGWLWLIDL